MEANGHECIAFCEKDPFALKSYKAMHNTEGEVEFHDITTVSDESIRRLGHIDVICGGFPCQAFSIAGKRRGFEDTRGTLFFEIARFASILRPRYLFLENVEGLLNHENGRTFGIILQTLAELGYDVEWQMLNSKDFGVPQNRKRVFIIGHLRGRSGRAVFPITREDRPTTKVYRGKKVSLVGNVNPSQKGMNGAVYDGEQGLAPTLTTNKGEGIKILQRARGYNNGGLKDIAPTLSSNSWHENNLLTVFDLYNKTEKDIVGTLCASGFRGNTTTGTFAVGNHYIVRKLTPRECFRLQGFPDEKFDKAASVNSNAQLYKQAGNSVTVNVIKAVAERLG